MLNDFKNEDFERFLKQNADGLRMRPSDKVWEGIHHRMNRRRRGVVITSALFLITASFFGYYLVDSSKSIGDPNSSANIISKPLIHTPADNTGSGQKENETFDNNRTAAINKAPLAKVIPFTTSIPSAAAPAPTATAAEGEIIQNAVSEDPFTPTLVDEYQPAEATAVKRAKGFENILSGEQLLTIESVVNSYKRRFKSPKTEWQFIFTPTVSYRRLTENKSFLREVPSNSTTFINAKYHSVNSMVSHKPALGLELGMAFKYRVSNAIKLRSGLQFNISRYDIKAADNYTPMLATIALNNRGGLDSMNTVTRFKNTSSQNSDWLENTYFQVSLPVGAELKLLGNEQTHLGIATTVQPTYIIGERAYLISTDYKNYSQVPSLTRRWNVHTTLETFVGYSTGKLKWQVGPQVRYQLLSSFDTEYPVKENLFDFGLKIGVSLNKQ